MITRVGVGVQRAVPKSNRRQSSPRPAPDPVPLLPQLQLREEQDMLFRHTFHARFDEDEECRALLALGRTLAEYQNESGQWGNGMEGPTGQLRAVATELNQIADELTP
jgi:hypothetical protein